MSRTKEIKWGILFSYLSLVCGFIMQIVVTPFIIKSIGPAEHGLYSLAISVVNYLNLFSFGIGSVYIKFYAQTYKDKKKLKVLNGRLFFLFSVIALIVLLVGIFISIFSETIFNRKLSSTEIVNLRIMLIILTVNLSITFISSVHTSYVLAIEKFTFQKGINLIKTIMQPLLSVALVMHGYKALALVISLVIFTQFVNMANIFCALKNRFSMHISIPTKSFLQSVFSYSIFIFLIMIVDQVNWNVDNLLLGIMKGTAAVSIYGVGSQFNSFFKSLSTSISSMMTPRIHKIQNMTCDIIEKNRKFTDLLISTGRIQFAVIMLAYTGLLFVGKSFILRWVGEQYEQSYYVVLCILGCEIIPLIENTATEIRRAKDMQKIPTVVSVVRAVLNVLISIPLCEKYGPVGCALGTTITMTMGVIFLNFYYELYMKLNMIRFWKEIGRLSLGLIVPFIFAIIARCKFEIITFEQIALFSVIYTIIYMMSMYFFGIYAQERKYIQEKIVMYIGKLKQLVEGI